MSGAWKVIASPTDPEMSAVQGVYLVADNLPIEDARLIAAAPDLLALAYQYRNDLNYPPTSDSRERRLASINAAIARATMNAGAVASLQSERQPNDFG